MENVEMARPSNRPKRRRGPIVLCILAVLTVSAVGVFCIGGYTLDPFVIEVNSLQQEARSPGGDYTAKLLYRENLAMTYGYNRVTIESSRDPGPRTELIEVADEGLERLRWKDRRTLVVSYDASNDKTEDRTLFVRKPGSWHDIKIEYEGEEPVPTKPKGGLKKPS